MQQVNLNLSICLQHSELEQLRAEFSKLPNVAEVCFASCDWEHTNEGYLVDVASGTGQVLPENWGK
jgi:hypothetical protein